MLIILCANDQVETTKIVDKTIWNFLLEQKTKKYIFLEFQILKVHRHLIT